MCSCDGGDIRRRSLGFSGGRARAETLSHTVWNRAKANSPSKNPHNFRIPGREIQGPPFGRGSFTPLRSESAGVAPPNSPIYTLRIGHSEQTDLSCQLRRFAQRCTRRQLVPLATHAFISRERKSCNSQKSSARGSATPNNSLATNSGLWLKLILFNHARAAGSL